MALWYYILKRIAKFFTMTIERPSPSDIVPRSSLVPYRDSGGFKLGINLKELNIPLKEDPIVWIPTIIGTNSMDPVMDKGNNNILMSGGNDSDQEIMVDFIKVGDVCVFARNKDGTGLIIHRIVKIGQDKEGRYFRFKGDNNPTQDPDVVRDSQIKWLSLGCIY